jgi:hypothetical protein
MCWRDEAELYNGGQAFKITCRDTSGTIVTVIADNYFGYCKKEVKTQISFAANLYGLCEEEHAGGALVFSSFDLGETFSGHTHVKSQGHTYQEMISLFVDAMTPHPDGYAVDNKYPDILYVSEDATFDSPSAAHHVAGRAETRGHQADSRQDVHPALGLQDPPGKAGPESVVAPCRYRCRGNALPQTLHRSGGGKSEISKAITDAILTWPVFVADFKNDFDRVAELIGRDYSDRFKDPSRVDKRGILSSERSLGSVIKLLTPDDRDYNPHTMPGCKLYPSISRNWYSSLNDTTTPPGEITGVTTSAWTLSTEFRATS